ncbi:GNAT family N-acetyltransferase [Streptomyces sp. NPDC006879]|uniref:GNAT family N-acetyltransferase n=1 Tax=Streptomyces sp. NPDC006879 TaxID=3364767 RepID=UPI0036837CA5
MPPNCTLQLLGAHHAEPLLAFERENRAYFAASVPDRGDAYFQEFAARHAALLEEQDRGQHRFHVLVDEDGAVLGRVNLVDVREDHSADLGFRIAARAAGRGLATSAVRELCGRAGADYGLRVLRAAATLDNAGSRTVLTRSGFRPTGPVVLDGRAGLGFLRELPA